MKPDPGGRLEIKDLVLGQWVQVRYFTTWYRARIFSIGRTRVSVAFQLGAGRGERRIDVPVGRLRPLSEA